MPGLRGKDEQSQDNDQREEDYEKLFPKIGRDFITREDLVAVLNLIVNAIPGLSIEVGNSQAIALATEYKKNLEEGKNKKYKDLIKLDEEPEENDESDEELE